MEEINHPLNCYKDFLNKGDVFVRYLVSNNAQMGVTSSYQATWKKNSTMAEHIVEMFPSLAFPPDSQIG